MSDLTIPSTSEFVLTPEEIFSSPVTKGLSDSDRHELEAHYQVASELETTTPGALSISEYAQYLEAGNATNISPNVKRAFYQLFLNDRPSIEQRFRGGMKDGVKLPPSCKEKYKDVKDLSRAKKLCRQDGIAFAGKISKQVDAAIKNINEGRIKGSLDHIKAVIALCMSRFDGDPFDAPSLSILILTLVKYSEIQLVLDDTDYLDYALWALKSSMLFVIGVESGVLEGTEKIKEPEKPTIKV